MKKNATYLFIIIAVSLFYTIIINMYIQTDEIFYNFLLNNYPTEIAIRIFETSHPYKCIIYISTPILIILRTLIFAIILDAVLMCKNIYESKRTSTNYKFSQFWSIFICAEWSYIAFITMKFCWFAFFDTNYDYSKLIDYSPLSLYSLIGNNNLDAWLIYPLKVCNLFEVLYLVIAIIMCKRTLQMNWIDSMFYICLSYLIPLFVFMIFIMYLNIHFL